MDIRDYTPRPAPAGPGMVHSSSLNMTLAKMAMAKAIFDAGKKD
jgi:hypothetical protein